MIKAAVGGVALLAGIVVAAWFTSKPRAKDVLPSSFVEIDRGPAGGSVWQSRISTSVVPGARPIAVYMPPGAKPGGHYPVLYALHGIPGSPYSIVVAFEFARIADNEIAHHRCRPFIGVMPWAGRGRSFNGEWTGVWERYVLGDVVPWVDAHLPTRADPDSRAIAGFSSGGYGAVDIALRHPGVFGTVESWSGFFAPPRNGSLADADAGELALHDPRQLVVDEGDSLRRDGVRLYMLAASGEEGDAARAFGRQLDRFGIPNRVRVAKRGSGAKLVKAGLPAALDYAFPPR